MFNFHSHRGSKHLNHYFKEHLSKGDYHSHDGEIPGTWIGGTCSQLGITEGGTVETEAFQALSDNLDPRNLKPLTPRMKSGRRSAYDFSFSAPKSVSVAALIGGDERLIEAHRAAVSRTFYEMERLASARLRIGKNANSETNIVTGNLVGARFEHSTSRENDPQMHTHIVTFNCTWVKEQNRFLAAQVGDITRQKNYFTALYRNELAQEVSKLGYRLENADYGWRLKDVPRALEEIYSKRSDQIAEAALLGKVESNKGRALLALKTRAKKEQLTEEAKLTAAKSQISLGLKEQLSAAIETSRTKNQVVHSEEQSALAQQAIQFAIRHTFERESITDRSKILTHALNFSQGRATLKQLDESLKNEDLIKLGKQIAETSEQARELRIVDFINSGINGFENIGNPELLKGLSDSQQAAAKSVLESKDRVTIITGRPGTGKTHTLKQILNATNLTPVVTAPRAGAAQRLRDDGITGAITVKKLLINLKKKSNATLLNSNSILVVDEAGLLSTKVLDELIESSKSSNCRVLLIGDDLQHHSVDSGDALRLVTAFTKTERAELTEIRRQSDKELKAVVTQMSCGDATRALESLDKMGCLIQANDNERPKKVAEAYVEAITRDKTALVVTPTWTEHAAVTEAIRARLKDCGRIGQVDTNLITFKSSSFTLAQKMTPLTYQKGHIVSFHADALIFKKGEAWRVVDTNYKSVTLSHPDGRLATEDPRNFALSIDVGVDYLIDVAGGDKLLLQANLKTKDGIIANGEVVIVKEIQADGAIDLTNGQKIPAEFRHFVHGYAATSQGSQGKDVDAVIVSIDASAAGAISKNQLNVSISRGKESTLLITNSKKLLYKASDKSEARPLIAEHPKNQIRSSLIRDATPQETLATPDFH